MIFRLSLSFAALALIGAATPTPSQNRVIEARVLLAQGNIDGATRAIEAALVLDPKNTDALLYGGNMVRDRYGLLAALPWYDRLLAIQPDHRDATFEKAATLGDAGRATAMLAESRQLLGLSKYNAQALYLQSVLAARAGKWDNSQSKPSTWSDTKSVVSKPSLWACLMILNPKLLDHSKYFPYFFATSDMTIFDF